MSYLIFSTKQEADDRSKQAWLDVLGRKKKPEDVTEFLWGRIKTIDGSIALDISEKSELLSPLEQSACVAVIETPVLERI